MKRLLLLILVTIITSGCASPKYDGASISNKLMDSKPEINLVRDDNTRKGFIETVKKWLDKNGYSYSVVPSNSITDLKKLTIEYVGIWRWDLALFLNRAEIEAFHNGQKVGFTSYKAPNNFNTNKFSNAEERIKYMMDILFGKITASEATQAIK
ncbi:hypothetical protein D5018_06210 [Parashewanella curva]|uniref:Lipoprotein n=1 Tax=Parashewanella curva TaxID=2338552 RepID=A0A3L8Q149_9GAMM|nr:Sbal_3080 family lipoprotein [Parashewanella curva]RLV60538.1 hypothetical protein D5018_06210 [Parashewanella curva]